MGRLLTFEMMRGFAALAVMAYHAERLVPRGYLAVDLFFMLSGFVLFRAYGSTLGSWIGFIDFSVRRVVRLYPLMFVGAAIGLLINGGSLLTLILIPNGELFLYPANIPLWSLLYEVVASILFAALFRYKMAIWIVIWIGSLALFAVAIAQTQTVDIGFKQDDWLLGLIRVGFSFSSGVALAYICRWDARKSKWSILAMLPLLVFFVPGKSALFDFVAIFSFFPAAIVLASRYDVPMPKAAIGLGAISYPLYAIHHPVVKSFHGAGLWYLVLFAGLILASMLLDRFVDRPVRRYLARTRREDELFAKNRSAY